MGHNSSSISVRLRTEVAQSIDHAAALANVPRAMWCRAMIMRGIEPELLHAACNEFAPLGALQMRGSANHPEHYKGHVFRIAVPDSTLATLDHRAGQAGWSRGQAVRSILGAAARAKGEAPWEWQEPAPTMPAGDGPVPLRIELPAPVFERLRGLGIGDRAAAIILLGLDAWCIRLGNATTPDIDTRLRARIRSVRRGFYSIMDHEDEPTPPRGPMAPAFTLKVDKSTLATLDPYGAPLPPDKLVSILGVVAISEWLSSLGLERR